MNCLVCAAELHDIFYTAIDNRGFLDVYCGACYQKVILDNFEGMVDGGGTKVVRVACECGTKSPMGQNHSSWCMLYRQELT